MMSEFLGQGGTLEQLGLAVILNTNSFVYVD